MSDQVLRQNLIRLAQQKPELRTVLKPLLKGASSVALKQEQKALAKIAYKVLATSVGPDRRVVSSGILAEGFDFDLNTWNSDEYLWYAAARVGNFDVGLSLRYLVPEARYTAAISARPLGASSAPVRKFVTDRMDFHKRSASELASWLKSYAAATLEGLVAIIEGAGNSRTASENVGLLKESAINPGPFLAQVHYASLDLKDVSKSNPMPVNVGIVKTALYRLSSGFRSLGDHGTAQRLKVAADQIDDESFQFSRTASEGYTLFWVKGSSRMGEVAGGPWKTEQEAMDAAKKVRSNLNALLKSEGRSGDLELLDPSGKRVKLIAIA